MGNYDVVMKRTEWFRKDRFGLFIHWGLYSVAARHEWIKKREKMTDDEYQKYFDNFTAEHYVPKEWAKMAKNAGMKYAVLTVKHHEGFCLFDSAYTDYKSTNSPAKRDLVKEFVEAFRAEGLKVGFYYSLPDWHHPDFPHMGDYTHPQYENPDYADGNRNFANYLTYLHDQVRELCTNYGKIDIFWFDFSYGEMKGEKWEASKLVSMMRSLQPHIVLNNRLVGSGGAEGIFSDMDTDPVYAGDFVSPEQYVPAEGILDCNGREKPWEACITSQADSWGYVASNEDFLSAKDVIYMLVDCVSKNGNLLLNIGPTAKGEFPKATRDLLKEIGEWMRENGESVYGCGAVDLPQPEWGRLTGKNGNIYAHIFNKSGYTQVVKGVSPKNVAYALHLEDYSECIIPQYEHTNTLGDFATITCKKANGKEDIDTVIKLVMKQK